MLARWQGASLTRQLIPSAFRPLLGLRFLLGQAEQPASGRFFWRTGRPGGRGFAAILAQLELFSLSAKVGANHASPSSAIVAFLGAFRRCKLLLFADNECAGPSCKARVLQCEAGDCDEGTVKMGSSIPGPPM